MDAERRVCRLRVFPLLPGKRDASSGCQWRVVFLSFETFKIIRNMKKRIFSVRTLLSGVLAMLGFAGCENAWNEADEYGSPSVDYRVIGEVTDEAGKPLSGIRVIVQDKSLYSKDGDYHTYNYEGDTVYTDAKGAFQSAKIHAGGIYKQRVVFDDVDGEANGGEFRSVDMSIKDLDSKQIKKGGDWYEGEYELSTKVQMKKK